MPTILYQSIPVIFLRTKKTGSHSVKKSLRIYAENNQVSYLEVRSKPSDNLDTHKYVSHMPAAALAKRLDVWNESIKFTFIRNPWEVLESFYNFLLYTGPKYGYDNPDNYDLSNFESFFFDLRSKHGTSNFNKEIYSIDDNIIAEVYDIKEIGTVLKSKFNITDVPVLNKQSYQSNFLKYTSELNKYIEVDYKWEIENFGYTKPLD